MYFLVADRILLLGYYSGSLTACISIVTVWPAVTGHLPATPLAPPTLHRMSVLVTLVTGELDGGIRMHVFWYEVHQHSRSPASGDQETYHINTIHP